MELAWLVEGDGDARSAGAEDDAIDVDRARRLGHLVADRNGPDRAGGAGTHQPRPLERNAHHGGVALLARGCGLDRAVWFAIQLAEIDRGVGVEDKPERIGADEHRGRRWA